MAEKKRGLGRGLDALLTTPGILDEAASESVPKDYADIKMLSVELIRPSKYQPRCDMSSESLEELAQSIKVHGIIQPIVVKKASSGHYEIIAGERRWRASQLARLAEVPVIVKDLDDKAASAIALIENIQREDLNAIDTAKGIQRLIDEHGLTHLQVAEILGKSRTTITNLLRLMSLENEVKTLLERGDIDMGHARALLSVSGKQQVEIARAIVVRALSVRETELLVKRTNKSVEGNPQKKQHDTANSPDIRRFEETLSERLGAVIHIRHKESGKGRLEIEYNNLDELEGILHHIQ